MFHYTQGHLNTKFDILAKEHFNQLRGLKNKINENARLPGKQGNFFRDLKVKNYKWAESIIHAKPKDLDAITRKIKSQISKGRYPKLFTSKGRPSTFGTRVKATFNYRGFNSKKLKWNAYRLSDKIAINVCPYCNRNYTFTIHKDDIGVVRPEFDHFYSQEKFPYLALSFYNLIPSCHTCNSNLKHTKQFSFNTHLHPFYEALDDLIRFTVQFKKKDVNTVSKHSFGLSFFYGDLESFDIELVPCSDADPVSLKKAFRNISTFKIRELYERHKDLVTDMILNATLYDDTYIDSLVAAHGNLFRDRADVIRHITKNFADTEAMTKRAFSKLTRDIHREFGIAY